MGSLQSAKKTVAATAADLEEILMMKKTKTPLDSLAIAVPLLRARACRKYLCFLERKRKEVAKAIQRKGNERTKNVDVFEDCMLQKPLRKFLLNSRRPKNFHVCGKDLIVAGALCGHVTKFGFLPTRPLNCAFVHLNIHS